MNFFKDLFKNKKIKRVKQESRKLPKGKKPNGKGVRIFVWVILLLIAVAGPLGFVRANNALSKSKAASDQVQENNKDSLDNQEVYESPKFTIYADQFIQDYINIPKGDDQRKGYMEKLETYFAHEDSLPVIGFEGHRELKDKQYYGKKRESDHVVAQYKIIYETLKKDEDDPNEHEMMINIPIRYDKGFAVVEPVSFEDVQQLKSDNQKEVMNPYEEGNEDEVSHNERADLEDWIEEFFMDYASESKEDMAYMMDKPKALNGLLEFQKISDLHVYKADDRFVAKVNVAYQEPGADITHQEPYTLKIKRMNGHYYVEKMEQTLGGK